MPTSTSTRALWVWALGIVPALSAAAFLGVSCAPHPSKHAVELMGGDCASCHMPEFKSALSPVHEGVYPTTCGACHTNDAWHPAINGEHPWFPLRNVHSGVACASCHVGDPPVYAGTPSRCVGCHADDRAQATNPSHDGFSDDCASCHNDTGWQPATFDHQWPLLGKHATATCASCHGDPPTYTGTPTTCVGCHADDRAQATNPSHDGFSDDCASCHNNNAWQPAMFDHQWPLTGQHASATCASCHGTPPTYTGTATACVGCHRDDYDTSPYPGHSAFPTTCESCHTTSGWTPATGGGHPENKFPTTGDHNVACNSCHDASRPPNSKANADCVQCHSRASTDGDHDEVGNYPSGAAPANFCANAGCHPDGRN